MRAALVVLLLGVVGIYATVSAPGRGNKINGEWLLGANLPWSNYGRDFGTNAWGYAGFAANRGSQLSNLQRLKDAGAGLVRVWLFADGRAGIDLDSQWYPGSVQSQVYADMDELISQARTAGVRLIMVLFDFQLGYYANTNNGVQMGGRNSWINYAPHVNALHNNVLPSFLQHYGNEPVIHSWEVMNEPEWLIWDLPQNGYDSSKANGCSISEFYTFASGICNLVHQNTNQYCTLGSASIKWAQIWTNAYAASKGFPALNLDYYQCHYYGWMDGQTTGNDATLGNVHLSPLEQNYNDLNLDRPMVVGEFYSTKDTVYNQLNTYVSNGFAGAWPWSVNSDYAYPFSDVKSWASNNPSYVPLTAPSTAASLSSNSNNDNSDDALAAGTIAGIVISSLAGAVLLAAFGAMVVVAIIVALVVVKRRRAATKDAAANYIAMTEEAA